MASEDVREIGQVETVHGQRVAVGVDHDAVTVNGLQIGPEAFDDFMRLIFQADEAAHWWAATQPGDDGEAHAGRRDGHGEADGA